MTPSQIEESILARTQRVLDAYLRQQYSHRYDAFTGNLEVWCQQTHDRLTATLVLRVVFDHIERRILIPNIFMPKSMVHQGIGKRTIKEVYETAKSLGYTLYITELTRGFMSSLLKRDAEQVRPDVVMITDKTDLA